MELLKIKAVAKKLGVSDSYAYELAARRVIPVVVIGGAIRVPADLLDRWITEHIELNEAMAK